VQLKRLRRGWPAASAAGVWELWPRWGRQWEYPPLPCASSLSLLGARLAAWGMARVDDGEQVRLMLLP
jgi:hypothetical protein